MKTKFYLLTLLSSLFIGELMAQVSFDAELRPRVEYRQGFKKPLADTLDPALVTLQRTRLSFDYKSKILNSRITLQDSRIWGNGDTKSSTSKLEIYEAWSEYLITSGLSTQFGRQILKYDDQRLLGAAAWSNTGLAHDVLLFKYKPSESWQAHAGFAYNNNKDTLMEVNYTTKSMYQTMGFLWLSKSFSKGLNITAIGIQEGLQKTNNYKSTYPRLTTGANINFQSDSSSLILNVLGYYQKGKSSTFEDLEAYMAAAKIDYKVYKTNAVFIGADYYSGTKSGAKAGTSGTFNKLYGANHSFNGNMEFWSTLPKSGLIDYYGGITGQISPKISIDATYHLFSLAEDYKIGTKLIDKNMGSELDLILNYKISKEIALQGVYCTYFNSGGSKDYFKTNGVDTHSNWAYVMLTIKPNFYKTPTEK